MYVVILFIIVDAASESVVKFISDSGFCSDTWSNTINSWSLSQVPINSNETPLYSPLIVVFPVFASVTIFIG